MNEQYLIDEICKLQEENKQLKQALVEAKRKGVREFLEKASLFKCPADDCAYCSEDLLCGLRFVVRQNSIDEIIKKVEGI